MTIDDLLDLLEFAIEPETWQCDDAWEYRAMHWRPSETSQLRPDCASLKADPVTLEVR